MARSNRVNKGHPIIFGMLALFGALDAAISTWLAVKYQQNKNYISVGVRDRTRLIALSSWATFLFSVVYIALYRFLPESAPANIASHGIFLISIWVLWTASAASITAALRGGVNCSTIEYKLVYCNQLNAMMAFSWTEWIITTFALLVLILLGISSRRRGDGLGGKLVV